MTTRLTRLRIAGFKSFAEPVSLDILPGLTGIVGPNGCGKSNVVEALRWAMGETSARSLRGGEMDDVIFAGTTARASRNLAEVTLTLEGALPAPFEADSELQVTRRIERGAGSTFRANGRELRARDVQTLYADLASGARSSGMVSQGRVAQLVNAKPEERRQVLEEAAGITGLHARRHEAELKLRQAEQNVQRAEDARAQLDSARDALRKQARQAARYKTMSGLIRAAEADHLAILHAQALDAVRRAEAALDAARAAADAANGEVATSAEALAEAEAALPAPREAEAQSRSTLERRRVEAESLAAESERLAAESAQAEQRLLELEADCEAAQLARADAQASVDRLLAEAARFATGRASLPAGIEAASAALAASRASEANAQAALDKAAAACTENAAALRQARSALETEAARLAACDSALAAAEASHDAALAAQISAAQLDEASDAVRAAADQLDAARADVQSAESARGTAERALIQARGLADREAANALAARQALADAQARFDAQTHARTAADAALAGLSGKRVPPETLDQAASEAAAAETALSLAEAELASAEHAAERAASLLAEASRKAEDMHAARGRAAAHVAASAARARALAAETARAEAESAQAEAERPDPAALDDAASAVQAAERSFAAHGDALKRLAAGRAQAASALADARAALAAAEADHARLAAEAEGLRAAMAAGSAHHDNALASLTVPAGLEAALGAALGEAADASLDPSAEKFIRTLPPLQAATPAALPEGACRLSARVDAPAALARVLAHTILLPAATDGAPLQAGLPPGTSLVRQDGACWRWDGQVIRAGAPNAAASRLAQGNRLRALLAACTEAAEAALAAQARLNAAAQDDAAASGFEDQARARFAGSENALRTARETLADVEARTAKAVARLNSLAPMVERLRGERRDADAALAQADAALMALAGAPDPADELALAARRDDDARQALTGARAARMAARTRLGTAQAELARLRDISREIEARIASQSLRADQIAADLAAASASLEKAGSAMAALPAEADISASLAAAAAAEQAARTQEAAARTTRSAAEQRLDAAKATLAGLRAESVRAETRLHAAETARERARAEQAQAQAGVTAARDRLAALPDQTALDAAHAEARAALDLARQAAADAQARLAGAEAALRQAEAGESLAAQELLAWRERLGGAGERLHRLAQRRDAARDVVKQLGDAPAAIAARAGRSAASLLAAEATHRTASDALAAAEQRVRALALARRDAERDAAARRESLLRAEAALDAARRAQAAVLARAAERLGEDAVLSEPDTTGPDIEEKARKKCERLARERDEMGPVNLRADIELEELDARLATLERERAELGTAIAKLRGSIGHLNREGRTRLEAVFTQVDQHFRTLFTRMMGGGRAHLALTGNDDPLLAGLEIYAEPPGKKLSALSLLSGGEQALTALSLIFAVFRCTPAPVSVLDEVDAPLDDANVERFCALLDDVVRDTGTRFLVVTHHQLTMSRMDRLFGVTMQERGVSRLLSVDLRRAAAMVEPALQAAE